MKKKHCIHAEIMQAKQITQALQFINDKVIKCVGGAPSLIYQV